MQPPTLEKELLQVSFLGIHRTTKLPNNFRCLHCDGVTLVKKCNKPLLQISETKICDQKIFVRLFQSQQEKRFGCFGNKSNNA